MSATFKVGATATARSACDHTCIWTFEVVKRTPKFVTLRHTDGRKGGQDVRVKVHALPNGDEFAFPLGSYSMAPVARPATSPFPRALTADELAERNLDDPATHGRQFVLVEITPWGSETIQAWPLDDPRLVKP